MKPIGRIIIAISGGVLFLSSSAACGKPKGYATEMSTDQFGSGTHLNTHASSERKASIATADRPARVSVEFQNATRSHGAARIELTLRPDVISPSERYVIQVFAVGLQNDAGYESAEEYLGSYAAFAPMAAEKPITMVVRAPQRLKTNGLKAVRSLNIEVRLEPVSPEKSLKETVLTVLDARIVP